MYRLLFAVSVAIVVIQLARPRGDGHVAVALETRRLMLDSATPRAMVKYSIRSRGGGSVLLRGSPRLPPVTLERQLGGGWYKRHEQPHSCAELPVRAWRRPLRPGETCTGRVVVSVPGRYRIRVAYAQARGGPLRPAYSPEFTVLPLGRPALAEPGVALSVQSP